VTIIILSHASWGKNFRKLARELLSIEGRVVDEDELRLYV
jgi:hypothetical protein